MHDPMGIPHELVEHNPLEHYLGMACKAMAVSGGLLFLALIAMSLWSILGRKLGFGAVSGDIELMQAGTAVAATAFLPYCTLLGEHIKVDFFTENLPERIKRPIDGLTDLLLALVAGLLTWRTALAAISVKEAGEVSPLVSLPIWWPTAALLPGLALMAICAAYRGILAFRADGKLPGRLL